MGKISLIIILIVASATFYFTSQSFKVGNSSQNSTRIDEAGHLHVMGLILGESTVRDAELAFRSRADAAIFMYPIENATGEEKFRLELEAYFPSIADHSKVMLTLDVDNATMEAIRKRATSPRMYPNGVARLNLGDDDVIAVQQFKIKKLVLMPSVALDLKILEGQFGKAVLEKQVNTDTAIYAFPKIGLKATINNDEKDKLVFTNPTPPL
ncbi:MAG: hypothetical protein AUK35_00880 [Zetaproteobacteria bacterium CG2_30_46_52]|nr:MAG: hypothetical protein AUK35_00880 [Zetaproteobacteria bacterium CG2_30_46_52]